VTPTSNELEFAMECLLRGTFCHGAASGCMALGSSPASESLDCESRDTAVSTGPTWRSLFCVVCTQITFGIKNGTIQQID